MFEIEKSYIFNHNNFVLLL